MKRIWRAAALAVGLVGSARPAVAFSFDFDWGNIPRCTTGHPNDVSNPVFTLRDVPPGTARIRFRLADLNATFDHGGGTVPFSAASGTIAPGAFTYHSPCPPNGAHTYRWTATALDGAGTPLATAEASKKYP